MSLFSVNTNVGAAVALRRFGETRVELATAQRRLATGLRVASVRDNGASWSIAQTQRGDIQGLNAVLGALQRTESGIDTALAGGQVVSDLLSQMRERALAATDTTLSDSSRAALNADFVQLRDQITRVVSDASFDGLNLIGPNAADYKVLAGLAQSSETYQTLHPNQRQHPGRTQDHTRLVPTTLDVKAERLTLEGPNVTVLASDTLTDAAVSALVAERVNTSLENTGAALARLGSTSRQIAKQQVFLRKLQDGLQAGVGNLVDADLGKESARLKAMQTREQLGIQAISLANAAPKVLLGLFRG